MAEGSPSRMLDPDLFDRGDIFCFDAQPYLGELFETVRARKKPLTVVVGAGVSMNSSLPSWRDLIDKMTNEIKNASTKKIALRDDSDLMRKAEIVLQILKDGGQDVEDHTIIRRALYSDSHATPGVLADSIARLVCANRKYAGKRARLLTTNFDEILEAALRAYFEEEDVESFSLKPGGSSAWKAWDRRLGRIGVMHLHGLVRQDGDPEEPIVLTESQFLKHGAQVRDVISNALEGACTIFIGLGMSDPNLIGPLYATAEARPPRFSLVVPPGVNGVTTTEAARYAISSARYLEDKLGLRPIFLKSYSQLNQVISDLALAVVEPRRYRPTVKSDASLVYRRRLTRALDDCYTGVGCGKGAEIPTGQAAEELTTRLHLALEIDDGPLQVLRELARQYGHPLGGGAGENFGLFLWLRSRELEDERHRYILNLVGTSVYAHREDWSLRHHVKISRETEFAAAQAVFTGNVQATNLTPTPIAQIWRGIFATPILLAGIGSDQMIGEDPADVLTVGAITLNSTFVIRTNGERVADEDLSLISKLDSAAKNLLLDSLDKAAQYAIHPN
ncbi:SIR2 family protein [Amycolatopsis sp. FBCC-B4732]|uniref:SIR2 family protein n=1 Tax=Amycolatopsis sp. FBCC-B4732 TaxID=3079339 RepID=UPI001FF5A15A|nr:SIR2 family protein [Amycolatopsis sp. FBCC-B4732]UOX92488.1 SIR2 family protein [Amycolatopsis sp. FBCC-B4732]